MRLLYAIPRYGAQFTSNETHGEIVRELGRRGVDVEVLSFTTRTGAGGPSGWGAGFGTERVFRHVQGGSLVERALAPVAKRGLHYEYFFSMLAGYRALVKPNRYDLVHIEGAFPLGAVAALSQPETRTPYVVTTTGGDLFRLPGESYGYGQYLLPRQLIRLGLRRAAWVRTNSQLSGRLASGYGANPARMTPIAVSIADKSFPPADMPLSIYRAESRVMLGEKHSWGAGPLIVCVARLISLKAPELLIESLPLIRNYFPAAHVIMIGPTRHDPVRGDYLAFLQRRAEEVGVTANCTFTGAVPLAQIRDYLAAADVNAVPSRLEGLNRVIIEAAAVGTPSVISDGAGAAELTARYGGGLIVPQGSVSALAHAITRILAAPAASATLATQAIAMAADHSASAIAARLHALYEEACG